MTLIRIQRKPHTLEAIQWTGGNWEKIQQFAGDGVTRQDVKTGLCKVKHGDGYYNIIPGWWLIKEPGGTFDVLDDLDFRNHYFTVD